MTLAVDADPLAVVDPGRDVDVELALLQRAPGAVAVLARMLDDLPAATAVGARLRADELAEHAARDLVQPAAALTAVARDRRRARLDDVAVAGLAVHRDLDRHLDLLSMRRVDERDHDLRRDVGAALPAACARAAAEEVVAEERREQVAEIPEVELGRPEAARP